MAADVLTIADAAATAADAPMFVGGAWEPAAGGDWIESIEPATGRVLARIAGGGPEDLDRAVRRAEAAATEWSLTPPAERGAIVAELARRLVERAGEFALLDARDNGSPISAMEADVHKGAKAIVRAAGLATELKGQTMPATRGRLHYTTLEPWGVVGRIIAFNHPTLFAAARLAPALIAGNAVVLKPSELASLSALALAGLAEDVLPPGVLSVLTGGPALGAAIARHPTLRRLSFTGSPATALAVQAGAVESGAIKTVTLELGGKNPIIVFDDADPAEAAAAVVRGMNFTRVQGQSCGSTSRLFVHQAIADEVVERVCDAARRIRIGDPVDPRTEMGALIDEASVRRCERVVERALADGGTVLAGGSRPSDPALAGGCFFEPTVIEGVASDSDLAQNEVFGPVLTVFRWDDVDECVRLANDVRFGLTASVWTSDVGRALRTAHRLHAGFIWVNDVELRFGGVPFGGWKDSGIGQEDGLEELISFTRPRVVNVKYA